MLAAFFTSQHKLSCTAQAVPKSSLGISEKTSVVTIIRGFIRVVSRIFEVTVMREILNCFSNVSTAVTLKQLTLLAISPLVCWPGWYTQDVLSALTFYRGKLLKELHVVLICGFNSSLSHPAIKVVGITLSQGQMGFDGNPRSDLLWKFALISATDANS